MVQAFGDLPFPPQDEEQGWASQGGASIGSKSQGNTGNSHSWAIWGWPDCSSKPHG